MAPIGWILFGAFIGGMGSGLWNIVVGSKRHSHHWTNWRRASGLPSDPRWQYRECHSCGFTEARNL